MTEPFYDEEKARQQERTARTPDMQAQRDLVLALLDLQPGEQVLEVGAGNGIFAREMLAVLGDGGAVTGVDNAEAMVAMAQGICPDATFLQGSASALPVEDGGFDVVTASQVLCFVPEIDRAVAEMYRALKPGGRLVILDSDWDSLVWSGSDRNLMRGVYGLLTLPYADAHVPRSLSRRLTASGFRITERRTHTVLNWSPDPDSYSGQLLTYVESMMRDSDAYSAADWDAWSGDQQALAAAGDYLFSLNRYIFCAEKP